MATNNMTLALISLKLIEYMETEINDPMNDISKIFEYSENAIFTTEIIPKTNKQIEDWWYIAQETGQHIAFYSEESMQIIANHFNKNYYCKNKNIYC